MAICWWVWWMAAALALVAGDELIAARCQSRCIRELEQRLKDQPEFRKQLKHETLTLCKNDQNCSSCVLPCKETIDTNQRCAVQVCKNASSGRACEDSCVFLEKVSRKKPGQCAKQQPLSADECSAECNRDADCAETAKCCTVGCSRVCTAPQMAADDQRLLPLPEGISVVERKRKRSAVIRWVMKKMSPQHTATNSNLFVIQWRWGVSKDPSEMTPWQTIMVRNKMYAILKHLLSAGRFYVFRIASVNQFGSLGFSEASLPFRLSKQVKAPDAPANFSLHEELFDADTGQWTVHLEWTPPVSELPVKDYLLTWWRSTRDGADLYERQTVRGVPAALVRRSDAAAADDEEEEEEEAAAEAALGGASPERRTVLLPAHLTRHRLDAPLAPDAVYVAELAAGVRSAEGELRGEPAVLVLRTRPAPAAGPPQDNVAPPPPPLSYEPAPHQQPDLHIERLPTRLTPHDLFDPLAADLHLDTEPESATTVFRADLQPPYVEAGQLRTRVAWLDHSRCRPQPADFLVRLRSVRCARHTSHEQLVAECVARLDDLHFQCDYLLEVWTGGELLARLAFATPSCARAPADRPVDCARLAQPRDGPDNNDDNNNDANALSCLPSNRDETNAVECEWQVGAAARDLLAYRAVLHSSRAAEPRLHIVPASVRRLRFDDLTAGTDYRLQIQVVTSTGLEEEVSTQFRTGAVGDFILQSINTNADAFQLDVVGSGCGRSRLALALLAVLPLLLLAQLAP